MISLLLALFFSAPAQANCNNLHLKELGDVDFNNDNNPREYFKVMNSGNGQCSFFVTFDNGGAPSYLTRRLVHSNRSDTLPVQLCTEPNCAVPLKHFPEATSNLDVITGTFDNGDGREKEKDLSVLPMLGTLTYERFGDYGASYTVRLYQGTVTGGYSLEDTETFSLRYRQSRKIDLSIVNSGGSFDAGATNKILNFGALSPGQRLNFDLVVKFNAGYRVKVSSANNGVLKHSVLQSTVPYTFNLAGTDVSLGSSRSSPVTVVQGSGASPAGGQRFPGAVTIGAVGKAQAGSYQDIVTITVTTTE